MRYPKEWTFVDQHQNDKFSGVVFLYQGLQFQIPPYVSLQIKDKEYFKASNYKYYIEYHGFKAYFNPQIDIGNETVQEVYIRSSENYDFIFKISIREKARFREFQQIFFNMLQSFNFGSSFF